MCINCGLGNPIFSFFFQELLIKRYSGNIRLCAMPHAGVSQMREFIQWRCRAQARYRLQRQCFTPRQPGNNGASSNWVHITVPGIIQPRSCFLNMLPPVFVSTCDVFYLFYISSGCQMDILIPSLKLSWSCDFTIFPGKSLNENMTWFLSLHILLSYILRYSYSFTWDGESKTPWWPAQVATLGPGHSGWSLQLSRYQTQ